MKKVARLAYKLAAMSLKAVAGRLARRRAPRRAKSDSDPSNLTLLGLSLLALALGYRK
jgi:hypothetical protein